MYKFCLKISEWYLYYAKYSLFDLKESKLEATKIGNWDHKVSEYDQEN